MARGRGTSIASTWTEKEDVSDGIRAQMEERERERQRKSERCGVRDATWARERDGAFLFHRTVETRACHGGGVGGCGDCAREGEDEKRG